MIWKLTFILPLFAIVHGLRLPYRSTHTRASVGISNHCHDGKRLGHQQYYRSFFSIHSNEDRNGEILDSKTTPSSEKVQTVTDLNLEQMFEVFDEAERAIPSPVATTSSSTRSTAAASAVVRERVSSSFKPAGQVGSSAPFGFFDPAQLTLDMDEDDFKLYQEAEVKHGRVAMLAFVGLNVGEVFHPFFNGQINGPAIYHFQQADAMLPSFWLFVTLFIAFIEGQTISNCWQPLSETLKRPSGMAKLKKSHTPGDLNFDPLGLKPKDTKSLTAMRTRELNNGRLAM